MVDEAVNLEDTLPQVAPISENPCLQGLQDLLLVPHTVWGTLATLAMRLAIGMQQRFA